MKTNLFQILTCFKISKRTVFKTHGILVFATPDGMGRGRQQPPDAVRVGPQCHLCPQDCRERLLGLCGSRCEHEHREPPKHPWDALCHCPALQMWVGICQKGGLRPLPCAWVWSPRQGVPRTPLAGQGSCRSVPACVLAADGPSCTENVSLSRQPPVFCRHHRRTPFPPHR